MKRSATDRTRYESFATVESSEPVDFRSRSQLQPNEPIFRPSKLQLRDEIATSSRRVGYSPPITHEADIYAQTLEVPPGRYSHRNILDYCSENDLHWNYGDVLEKQGSSTVWAEHCPSPDLVAHILRHYPIRTDICFTEFPLYELPHDAAMLSALRDTQHLTSFNVEIIDSTEDCTALVMESLSGHHQLRTLDIGGGESAICPALRHKDRLADVTLRYLTGDAACMKQVAAMLVSLPALERLHLDSEGNRLDEVISAWARQVDGVPVAHGFRKLQHLSLADDRTGSELVDQFVPLISHMPMLSTVEISSRNLNPATNQLISSIIKTSKSLTQIRLRGFKMKHPKLKENIERQLILAEQFIRLAFGAVLTHK
jgi:hypothetical protein